MTYEERMKDFCLHCPQRCKEQACGYVMRNLERDCIYLQDVMTGWELGQQDTLEVKEVDLEKEIEQSFINLDYHLDEYNRVEDYVGENIDMVEYERIAKHFFELGLKARTDKELVEEIYSHIDSIKDTADRMTSGNFMHNKAAIKFSANTIAKVLELIGLKAQKGE